MPRFPLEQNRERYAQMVADMNDLLDAEGSTVKRITVSELIDMPRNSLLLWTRDITRRRLALGLPENVEIK